MRKLFVMCAVTALLLAGCGLLLERSQRQNVAPKIQETAADYGITEKQRSSLMESCLELIQTKPGDVEFVQSQNWKFVCSESGDPVLDQSGDFETLGYTDFEHETIYLDAFLLDESVIVHEAAHAMDYIAISDLQHVNVAQELGYDDWYDNESYWDIPQEMFAESRVGCLGYPVQHEYTPMDCSVIDRLIQGSDFAQDIVGSVKSLSE